MDVLGPTQIEEEKKKEACVFSLVLLLSQSRLCCKEGVIHPASPFQACRLFWSPHCRSGVYVKQTSRRGSVYPRTRAVYAFYTRAPQFAWRSHCERASTSTRGNEVCSASGRFLPRPPPLVELVNRKSNCKSLKVPLVADGSCDEWD